MTLQADGVALQPTLPTKTDCKAGRSQMSVQQQLAHPNADYWREIGGDEDDWSIHLFVSVATVAPTSTRSLAR
jgi:hypothetical protein